MRPHGLLRVLLVALFVGVPLAEVYVLVQVGQVIGAWWTILLLILFSVLGAWLVRREGSRAWRELTAALQAGRMPARELADGALVLIGGTLLLTPGFLTDAVGALLVLPLTRPVARRMLTRVLSRRLLAAGGAAYGPGFVAGFGQPHGPGDARRPGPGSGGSVVRGEVVDEPERPDEPTTG